MSAPSSADAFAAAASDRTHAPLVRVRITAPGAVGFPVALNVSRDTSVPCPPEAIDDAPYSHGYTGKHDGGALPPLRTDNLYAHVLSALAEAVVATDEQLQKLLPDRGGGGGGGGGEAATASAPAPAAAGAAAAAAAAAAAGRKAKVRGGPEQGPCPGGAERASLSPPHNPSPHTIPLMPRAEAPCGRGCSGGRHGRQLNARQGMCQE
jgi:hypothetical protein